MSPERRSRPVDLFDDLDAVVQAAGAALRTAVDRDWDVPATGLEWTCWETLEHLADDFFAYAGQVACPTPTRGYVPFAWDARRPGGPEVTVRSQPDAGNAGLVQVVETCAAVLSSVVRGAPYDARAWHPYGTSDPAGFAAMGTVETTLHLHDAAGPLGLTWAPDPEVVGRALDRLFPDAPRDTEPWPTLLWATGRGDLPGHARVTRWQWDGSVR